MNYLNQVPAAPGWGTAPSVPPGRAAPALRAASAVGPSQPGARSPSPPALYICPPISPLLVPPGPLPAIPSLFLQPNPNCRTRARRCNPSWTPRRQNHPPQ